MFLSQTNKEIIKYNRKITNLIRKFNKDAFTFLHFHQSAILLQKSLNSASNLLIFTDSTIKEIKKNP